MKFSQTNRRWVALFAILAFLGMCEVNQAPLRAENTGAAGSAGVAKESSSPCVFEKSMGPTVVKKRSPILWIVLGAALIAGAAYVYFYILQKFTLTVTKTAGIQGQPEAGSTKHKRTDNVSYSYTLMPGYKNLTVTLDGMPIAASGSVKMNGNHTLAASAAEEYMLTVNKGSGVSGTPSSGTYSYQQGDSASYDYITIAGYKNLVVKIDGAAVAPAGTIVMNANHTLEAAATNALELYWPFTGDAQDSSGKGRHGTVYGATLTSDRFGIAGRAYYVDGAKYIQGQDFSFHDGNQITAALWVRLNRDFNPRVHILWGNDFFFTQGTDSQGNDIIWFTIDDRPSLAAGAPIPKNTWVHVAGTYDGTTIRFYRNGILMGSSPRLGSIPLNHRLFTISRFGLSEDWWVGDVDEVRVYSYCMSQAEIAYLAGL